MLQNNTYLAVVGSFTTGLRVSNAGTSDPQTSFFYDIPSDTWFYQTSTPVVRLNFDSSIGLEENFTNVSCYLAPNPTAGESSLTIDSKNLGVANITITDMSGKEICAFDKAISEGSNTIALSSEGLNAGVYFVNVSCQGSTKTMKLIKK